MSVLQTDALGHLATPPYSCAQLLTADTVSVNISLRNFHVYFLSLYAHLLSAWIFSLILTLEIILSE